MSCKDFENDLVLHADGELRGQAGLSLLAHLQNCPDCGRKIIAHQQLRASVARVMGELKAPADLQATILSSLDAHSRPQTAAPAAAREGTIRFHWPAAMAAVIALTGVALWQYQPWETAPVTAASLQPVRVSDDGPVAVEIAKNVHKLHIKCATLGPAHHDSNLARNAPGAADRLSASLGFNVLSGDRLRLDVGPARFESARACSLLDSDNVAHPVAHLIYRNRAEEPISLFSVLSFPDVTGLKTRSVNGRVYAILAPALSTKCHPFTIVVWSSDRSSYLVCAPFADEETMNYVEPLRIALQRDPSLAARLLASLDRPGDPCPTCARRPPPG